MAMLYYFTTNFTNITNTNKTFLKKTMSLEECIQLVGMLWRQTLGDESEATKFRRPRRWMSSPRWEASISSFYKKDVTSFSK